MGIWISWEVCDMTVREGVSKHRTYVHTLYNRLHIVIPIYLHFRRLREESIGLHFSIRFQI